MESGKLKGKVFQGAGKIKLLVKYKILILRVQWNSKPSRYETHVKSSHHGNTSVFKANISIFCILDALTPATFFTILTCNIFEKWLSETNRTCIIYSCNGVTYTCFVWYAYSVFRFDALSKELWCLVYVNTFDDLHVS